MDYSLTGADTAQAIERGLAEADWYQCPVPRAQMRQLLERRDGPAIRDTLLWFGLIVLSGAAGAVLWGSGWAVIPFAIYGALYTSTSDSRWHESGHGTAFRTDWLNRVLYEIASFMVMRESVVWRWSHVRHHSDTLIVGRDPEIAVPRPPDIKRLVLGLFGLPGYPHYFRQILRHARGRMSADEKSYIPASEFPKVWRRARIYAGIYAAVLALSIYERSLLPLLLVGFPALYGSWLMGVYGFTQHAGLAENVLDHRLNCRTVHMNRVNRFLYWNMNYHVEHHMFPLVPYHALPRLHALVREDMPEPYPGLFAAWREIIPAVLRQVKDPAFHVKRRLPPAKRAVAISAPGRPEAKVDADGWVEVCAAADLGAENVVRFDYGRRTFAVCRDAAGALRAADGMCTHGNTHLADGLVMGQIIECPKHNGRFSLVDGAAVRAPACRGLAIYPVRERDGRIYLGLTQPGGVGARAHQSHRLRVVSNLSVATFIKELVLETEAPERLAFIPGDYLQFAIPPYERIRFRDFEIPAPYAEVWERQHVFDLTSTNPAAGRRNNYSLACNPRRECQLRLNVRIATPPPGQECPPGVGSSYMFSLKPGDVVTAAGPFGDFHLKPTQREMVFIGGGAGMAPLRAQLSHLFENEETPRKVSFWYGARSRQELYYQDYFAALARLHPNFSFHVALSSPLAEDQWTGKIGFIHEVVGQCHLRAHPHPQAIEYYLCGPPMMIRACTRMLADLKVPAAQIAFDEF